LEVRSLVLSGVITAKAIQTDEYDVWLLALFGSIVPFRTAHLSMAAECQTRDEEDRNGARSG